jgi:hypothetical protein
VKFLSHPFSTALAAGELPGFRWALFHIQRMESQFADVV